jgi:hypothetical protein
MTRTQRGVIGALIGIIAGVSYAMIFDDPGQGGPLSYVPRTAAGWAAHYVAFALPWAIIGAIIGALRRTKGNIGTKGGGV